MFTIHDQLSRVAQWVEKSFLCRRKVAGDRYEENGRKIIFDFTVLFLKLCVGQGLIVGPSFGLSTVGGDTWFSTIEGKTTRVKRGEYRCTISRLMQRLICSAY